LVNVTATNKYGFQTSAMVALTVRFKGICNNFTSMDSFLLHSLNQIF
jgi:hypothetical protein